MTGFVELAAELCGSPEVEEQKRLLRRITQAASRMDEFIRDALNYSEAIRKHLPLAPIDPSLLLRGMLNTHPELQSPDVRIQVQPDMPFVYANEAGLTQAVSSLLHNAIKFAKCGQPAQVRIWAEPIEGPPPLPVDLTASPQPVRSTGFAPIPSLKASLPEESRPTSWIRIWIEDQGIGISAQLLGRVFNMFSRGSHEQAGTGIGLALVRKVVDRMGGRVGVESTEGQGSRFWIELLRADGPCQKGGRDYGYFSPEI